MSVELRADAILDEGMPQEIVLSDLEEAEPVAPRFIVPNMLPEGEPSLLAGHGGTGKSLVGLILAVCVASGKPFYGNPVQRRRVAFLSYEDNKNVLHWRLSRICHWLGINLRDLEGRLFIWDAVHAEAPLMTETRDGLVSTSVYDWVQGRMESNGAQVLVLDGASDAFDGDENKRAAVRKFIRALRKLIPADGALLLLAHVDKSSARTPGTSQGYSGSTAWNNSVRCRWYLREEDGRLVLDVQKSNLGGTGYPINLQWNGEAHLFTGELEMPVDSLTRQMAESDNREKLVQIIRDADPPIPCASTGPRTAFTAMQARGLPEFYQRDKRRFWRDLEALMAAKTVIEVEYRTKDRKVRRVLGAA